MDILSLVVSLVIDTSFSWARMFIALAISILISIGIGIWAATSSAGERIVLPVVDVLQTLPILAFFPFVIFIIVASISGAIGINLAVIFLIVTSMIWNIIFGVYESIKTMPKEYTELASLYRLGALEKLKKVFVPASMSRVMEQSVLSWSIGLFYLVTSEIFSTGNANYAVKYGIGVAITALAASGNALGYLIAIAVFIIFVIATRFLFFMPLESYFNRYNRHMLQPVSEANGIIPYARQMGVISYNFVRRLNPTKLTRIGTNFAKRTLKAGKRLSKGVQLPSFGRFFLYVGYAIVAIIIIGAAYFLVSHNLLGDEAQVLVALIFSFARVWLAFLVALAIAVPLCVYLIFITQHSSKYLLLFQVLASIPATILLPAIASSLKAAPYSGELIAFIVFFLSGVWYLIFSTMWATKSLSPSIIEVKKVFGVKGFDAWKKIYVRAIIPGLITGAITGIAAEWNASIVAEYFAFGGNISQVGTGIGKFLDVALAHGNLPLLLLALANLTAMILILNTFVWKRFYRKVSQTYR